MPRSIASLSLSFGLVSIPVKVYAATESSAAIRFKLLARGGARVRRQYVAEESEALVAEDDDDEANERPEPARAVAPKLRAAQPRTSAEVERAAQPEPSARDRDRRARDRGRTRRRRCDRGHGARCARRPRAVADGEGLRVREGTLRHLQRRRAEGARRRVALDDRHRRVHSRARGRPGLLRQGVLPRTRPAGSAALQPAARRDAGEPPHGAREVGLAREGIRGADPGGRGRARPPAAALRRGGAADRGAPHRARRGRRRRARARAAPDRADLRRRVPPRALRRRGKAAHPRRGRAQDRRPVGDRASGARRAERASDRSRGCVAREPRRDRAGTNAARAAVAREEAHARERKPARRATKTAAEAPAPARAKARRQSSR